MAKKSSVYFGPPLAALTSDLKDSDTVSGKINRTAERYLEIIKRHKTELTDDEKQVLLNCLSGAFVDPLLIRHLADEVADSGEYLDGSEAAKSLHTKLESASFVELVVIVESLGF